MKLTIHLHLVPRSRMNGAIPPLPYMPSRRSSQSRHGDNFAFNCHNRNRVRLATRNAVVVHFGSEKRKLNKLHLQQQ